jgi:K+ transporter
MLGVMAESDHANLSKSQSAYAESDEREGRLLLLCLGALGIVFGDIGTSRYMPYVRRFMVSTQPCQRRRIYSACYR